MYDLVLIGGQIIDGTRSKPYSANLCISGNKIAAIVKDTVPAAKEVLDVTGLVVSPGFIDIHSHSDLSYRSTHSMDSKLLQGVTTEIPGNCGTSVFPSAANKANTEEFMKAKKGHPGFETITDYAADYNAHTPSLNAGFLIGHSNLRIAVMGFVNRDPDAAEMEQLKALLDREMSRGAFGMSLGLIYPPSAFSAKEELIELSKVVAKYNGILAVHMRNEGPKIFEAVDEMIEIAEKSGVHVQISHLKLMGKPQWGKADQLIAKLDEARAKGLNITCDQYPFPASSTNLSALVPHWAHEGGQDAMVARIAAREGDIVSGITKEMDNRGGPEAVLICAAGNQHNEYIGKTIAALSVEFGMDPTETVIKVLLDCKGSVSSIYFSMNNSDIHKIMQQMYVCIGSDGTSRSLDPALSNPTLHPRNYAAFSQYFQTVREEKLLLIEDMVYKATGLTANILGITDRGILKEGYFADIAVFDPEKFASQSTFLASVAPPIGMHHVIVNGKISVKDGVPTKVGAGLALFKP